MCQPTLTLLAPADYKSDATGYRSGRERSARRSAMVLFFLFSTSVVDTMAFEVGRMVGRGLVSREVVFCVFIAAWGCWGSQKDLSISMW